MSALDVNFVRQHFPALSSGSPLKGVFFDSAAGSLPCQETIEALHHFYLELKVQPGNPYPVSEQGMAAMRDAKSRWARALGVKNHELGFGPSTTQNIYVLAQAFAELFNAGDEIILTTQDHESNIGSMVRAMEAKGITVKFWQPDAVLGLLAVADLRNLITDKTRLVCFPHASNVTGQKNPAADIIALAKSVDAYTLVDGVSYAPHALPDVTALGADVYVFSLYKVYSVHLGVMVVREALLEKLPKQGHFFKETLDVNERLVPAGPDHAQTAAASGTLDYIETLSAHHGGPTLGNLATDKVYEREVASFVSSLWLNHEQSLVAPLLACLSSSPAVRLLGSDVADEHRCPVVSFYPEADKPADLSHILCDQGVYVSAAHYYAPRLLSHVGIEPNDGVVRISMAHYNSLDDVELLVSKLEALL
jgi:selenocysteine lyase/cysteine desulfurase